MKKLINKPEDVVTEALQGIAAAHPDLVRVHTNPNYIVRADAPVQGKAALVSGGGSGHEPMHGGFVGMGMLDAACPGEVFTSPTPDQMLEATKAVNGGAGVVHIVKNYTGDVMNFDMAAEMARGEGIEQAHADLVRVSYEPNFIVRADAPVQGKVALISGGGSGHEPMHGGFVGQGMLDAACPGEVFTSPTPDQMEAATKAVNGGAGVIHIVKNYTGDVMNFDMAAELCRSEGIEVESVLVDDDVAVKDSLYTAGRRGVGTTVLMEKIGGAAAEEGRALKEVADVCREVNANGRSMGMALTSCTVPAAGKPTFELGDDEMEIGIGIHGEPGRERMKLKPVAEIVEMMATVVVDDLPFAQGDDVLAFVNGMGGTPLIELYIVYNELAKFLKGRGISISRNLIGSYITSLEMAGCSITLLKASDDLLRLWDAPVKTAGLRWGV